MDEDRYNCFKSEYNQTFKDILNKVRENWVLSESPSFQREKYIKFMLDIDALSQYLYAPLDSVFRNVIKHYGLYKVENTDVLLIKGANDYHIMTEEELGCTIRGLVKRGILYDGFYIYPAKKNVNCNCVVDKLPENCYANIYRRIRSDNDTLEKYQAFCQSVSTQTDF